MSIPGVIYRLIGKDFASKLGLQEGIKMDGIKPWYMSKTIWSDVATVVLAIVGFVDLHYSHGQIATNPIYQAVLGVLGATGIYTRSQATDKLVP